MSTDASQSPINQGPITGYENRREPANWSRRAFLKTTTAAIAGAGLAPALIYAESAPKKVKIGVVGGNFGSSFYWHEHPDCVVAAVSDLRPERRANLMKTYGCDKPYDSLADLVKDKDLDAVAIFTDAPLHVPHAVEALKHGKHVISAVPACFSVEEADLLYNTVKETGLTYMMAETTYFQQPTISARKFQEEGKFGEIFYCEAEYQHPGLESLYFEGGKRTWRHGLAPMHYPTHCTAFLISVTGERLTEVVCHGWGNDDPILKDNAYKNPFWNGSAMFKTTLGHGFRVNVWWAGAHRGCERAQWIGTKMSFYCPHPNGLPAIIVRSVEGQKEKDDAGFVRDLPDYERYRQPNWWQTDMLPEPLRHDSGHYGSHTFLTHEFIDALTHNRKPKVNVCEALSYTVPGIVAHQSALNGGELKKVPQFNPIA